MEYQQPDPLITRLYENPINRKYLLSPDKIWLVILEGSSFLSIDEMSANDICLAGARINTANFSKSRSVYFSGITIKNMRTGHNYPVQELPTHLKINNVSFSPNGKQIAFQQNNLASVHLWVIALETFTASLFSQHPLNSVLTSGYMWLSDTDVILQTVRNDQIAIKKSVKETKPIIHDTRSQKTVHRTYADLLTNEEDELLFEYYTSSQLIVCNSKGSSKALGKPSVFLSYRLSPDKEYILLKEITRPFSYTLPYSLFGLRVRILKLSDVEESFCVDLPAVESRSANFSAVTPYCRDHQWRCDQPATIYWIKAEDDGDPDKVTEIRDCVWELAMGKGTTERKMIFLNLRLGNVYWGNDTVALVYEWWWATRKMKLYSFNPSAGPEKTLLLERSFEDSLSDPGKPFNCLNPYGQSNLYIDPDNFIYLKGETSDHGVDISFLKKMSLADGSIELIWKGAKNSQEQIIDMIHWDNLCMLICRESSNEYPNLIELNIQTGEERMITNFENPYDAISGIQKHILKYNREDGVQLQAALYLPESFSLGDPPLPCLLWAYPKEYNNSSNADNDRLPNAKKFPIVKWDSVYPFVLKGYAVVDDVSFPIIQDSKDPDNSTFIEQLILNAKAIIKQASDQKYIDPSRVAIGGHSYGAFMVANLMSHSSLFKIGIARSGAYNRTLTPFGYQNEDRTLWEASSIYHEVSPFNHADKMKYPLLLIHGLADENPGTAAMQSERYYQAVKANGGQARLVLLPYEGHRYLAKESVLHMLWEMEKFLELL